MSSNKMVVPGFGAGSCYGTPITLGLAPTSTLTLTGTVLPAGQYHMVSLAAGISFNLVSTGNGITGTYTILSGAPGRVSPYDGVSGVLVSTTTSVTILAIAT